ncbi:hypothetical protein ACKWTF_010060 [Chironomus riparius]
MENFTPDTINFNAINCNKTIFCIMHKMRKKWKHFVAISLKTFNIKLVKNLISRISESIFANYFVSFRHIENQPRITFKISTGNRFKSIKWLCAHSRSSNM